MITDPIGDLINRIQNAGKAKREFVMVPYSAFRHAVANKLRDAGYVKEVAKRGKKTRRSLEIVLHYDTDGTPKVHQAVRLSKPSRRLYERAANIRPIKFGKGVLVLSTPQGIMTDKEAREAGVGGELLFKMW